MASRLTLLASAASAYLKRRSLGNATAEDDTTTDARSPAGLLSGLFSKPAKRRRGPPRPPTPPGDLMLSEPGAPPASPPPPPRITGNAPTGDDWDDEDDRFDNITILGRDKSYDEEDWQQVADRMRLVNSSNVYGYYFQLETRTMGILYVQYLDYTPKSVGGSGERGGPGPVYAYYDIPLAKYRQFEAMAESTAGGAVWDYCRVRGSKFEHQHTYRLIQTSGDYVPRKTTALGFKRRNTASIGIGKRNKRLRDGGHARLQLGEHTQINKDGSVGWNRVLPNRGVPNRGTPNRGR